MKQAMGTPRYRPHPTSLAMRGNTLWATMAPALGRIEGVDGACLENENENEKEREGGKRLCLKKVGFVGGCHDHVLTCV